MRDAATRRSRRLATATALAVVLTSAVNAGQGPAAVVERVSSSQQAAYASWDSCGGAPVPDHICTVTTIIAGQDAVGTFRGLTVNRGVYEVTRARNIGATTTDSVSASPMCSRLWQHEWDRTEEIIAMLTVSTVAA